MSGGDRAHGYLVECYWPGLTQEKGDAAAERVRAATSALRRDGGEAVHVGSILVPADEAVFYVFQGAEADVLEACRGGGLSFERVVEAVWMEGAHDRKEEQR